MFGIDEIPLIDLHLNLLAEEELSLDCVVLVFLPVILRKKVLYLDLEEFEALAVVLVLDRVDQGPDDVLIDLDILILVSKPLPQGLHLLVQALHLKGLLSDPHHIVSSGFLALLLDDYHGMLLLMLGLGRHHREWVEWGVRRLLLPGRTTSEGHKRRQETFLFVIIHLIINNQTCCYYYSLLAEAFIIRSMGKGACQLEMTHS